MICAPAPKYAARRRINADALLTHSVQTRTELPEAVSAYEPSVLGPRRIGDAIHSAGITHPMVGRHARAPFVERCIDLAAPKFQGGVVGLDI